MKDLPFGKGECAKAVVRQSKTTQLWPAPWQPQLPHSQQSVAHGEAPIAKRPLKNPRNNFWAVIQPPSLPASKQHSRSRALGASTPQREEGHAELRSVGISTIRNDCLSKVLRLTTLAAPLWYTTVSSSSTRANQAQRAPEAAWCFYLLICLCSTPG